jgi:hypothetical protein
MAKYLAWVKQNIYEFPVAEKKQKKHSPSLCDHAGRCEETKKHSPSLCDHAPAPASRNPHPSVQKVFWGVFWGESRVLAEIAE